MAIVIDSDLVPERERVDYWFTELARKPYFLPARVYLPEGTPFRRRLLLQSLGHVQVFRMTGTPSRTARTSEMISASDPEYVSLMIQVDGHCWQKQGDRMSQLGVGDAVIHDTSHPLIVHNFAPFDLLIFAFPRALLRPYADRVCSQTAIPVSSNSGAGSLAIPFLRRVGDALKAGMIAENDANIGESVLGLVKALYLDPPAPAPSRQIRRSSEDILRSIRSSIEKHLGDPDLSPETIARANYVSASYLHKLFQKHEGMSVGAWVRATRLQRCHRDLLDAALADLTITAIASAWGFQSASHFSRTFRDEFGCSPRELRRSVGHAAVPELAGKAG